MSMKEAEVSYLFPFIWDGIYEADPVAVKTPFFCQVFFPPSLFHSVIFY